MTSSRKALTITLPRLSGVAPWQDSTNHWMKSVPLPFHTCALIMPASAERAPSCPFKALLKDYQSHSSMKPEVLDYNPSLPFHSWISSQMPQENLLQESWTWPLRAMHTSTNMSLGTSRCPVMPPPGALTATLAVGFTYRWGDRLTEVKPPPPVSDGSWSRVCETPGLEQLHPATPKAAL